MKSKSVALIFLLFFFLNSFAQERVRSMSDGKRRIFYTDIIDAENKLLAYYEERKEKEVSDNEYSSKYFPYEIFKDLVLHDERTMYHDFNIQGIEELYSEDKCIKIYSWNTGEGGAVRNFVYDGIFSYQIGGMYSALSPTYDDEIKEIVKEEECNNIIPLWLNPNKITFLKQENDVYTFIVNFNYRTYGYSEEINAYSIDSNGRISKANVFEMLDGNLVSEVSHAFLPGWSEFNNCLEGNASYISIPVMFQPKETEGYCYPHPSGRVQRWHFDGSIFKYDGVFYDKEENINAKLRNYSSNVVTLEIEPWSIRIDLMPNGAYRYSSWKNKSISETPDLVINNGYRTTPTKGDKGFHSLKEQYVFQNDEYFYVVSYEMVIYNGRYECYSPRLVVKRNDKVLMSLSNANVQ